MRILPLLLAGATLIVAHGSLREQAAGRVLHKLGD